MSRVAVILFPGSNCEEETKRASEKAGLDADIVRWNAMATLKKYDGYILPGGWSYEDRIRAGAVASHDEVMDIVKEAAAKGKPVLGICNGCQVLVESGLIPGDGKISMGMAPNVNPHVSGFYCSWVNVKKTSDKKTAFSSGVEMVMPIPIAHGEGRFVTKEPGLIGQLEKNQQIVFKYCDGEGSIINEFPINPNGSFNNIAGICNKEGNVLALMPHPERCSWMRQVPDLHAAGEDDGPGLAIFKSMKEFLG
jgi:phosphoribosylformylglycinamidine synthase subunit PurQ / glutaminase